MATFVTGVAGFLGSHVGEHLLRQGQHVVGVDDLTGGSMNNVPAGVEFVEASVCDADRMTELFEAYRMDYVFHLAAYAAEGLSHFVRRYNYSNNLIGSVNLINAAVVGPSDAGDGVVRSPAGRSLRDLETCG